LDTPNVGVAQRMMTFAWHACFLAVIFRMILRREAGFG
jgi:hypothetical protein